LNQGEKYDPLSMYATKTVEAFKNVAHLLNAWLLVVKLESVGQKALYENSDFVKNKAALIALTNFENKQALNDLYKKVEELVTFAEKVLKPKDDKTFGKADIKTALRTLADARKLWVFVADRIAYFEEQLQWLTTRFPDNTWCDVEGLCKIADLAEIQEQGYSLNPGRYVGVAIEDDGMTATEFKTFLEQQADTLQTLNETAQTLHTGIEKDILSLAEAVNTEGV
jgi:type I restriction enzyme M protein